MLALDELHWVLTLWDITFGRLQHDFFCLLEFSFSAKYSNGLDHAVKNALDSAKSELETVVEGTDVQLLVNDLSINGLNLWAVRHDLFQVVQILDLERLDLHFDLASVKLHNIFEIVLFKVRKSLLRLCGPMQEHFILLASVANFKVWLGWFKCLCFKILHGVCFDHRWTTLFLLSNQVWRFLNYNWRLFSEGTSILSLLHGDSWALLREYSLLVLSCLLTITQALLQDISWIELI